MNVSKAELEGAFADELALLQPTAGYRRLVKDPSLHAWERRVGAKDRTAEQEKRVKVVQQSLDRLDEAFLFAQSIDATKLRTATRQAPRGADARADRPPAEGSTNSTYGHPDLAQRVLPRASDLWVQASLDSKQRLQRLFFPEGIAYDGIRFNRTAVTAPLFNYLGPSESADE